MKTNLDNIFKANPELEENGVWFEVSEGGPKFLVTRYSPDVKSVREIAAKVVAPYKAQINLGTISDEKAMEVQVKAFTYACVKDWHGIEINGEFPAFSKDLCVKLLMHAPALYRNLEAYASNIANYRDELGKS